MARGAPDPPASSGIIPFPPTSTIPMVYIYVYCILILLLYCISELLSTAEPVMSGCCQLPFIPEKKFEKERGLHHLWSFKMLFILPVPGALLVAFLLSCCITASKGVRAFRRRRNGSVPGSALALTSFACWCVLDQNLRGVMSVYKGMGALDPSDPSNCMDAPPEHLLSGVDFPPPIRRKQWETYFSEIRSIWADTSPQEPCLSCCM